MGNKYLDTKEGSLEQSILGLWQEAAKSIDETNKNDKSDDGDGLDAVQPKAVKKKFKDRKDKDVDNDGDVDSSDKYLHKRRKAVSKAMKEAKQKPYVSSDRGEFHVMNGSGQIAKSFKDKKLAMAYFEKNYDKLMKEGLEDSPNPANSQHLCAKNVVHEEW